MKISVGRIYWIVNKKTKKKIRLFQYIVYPPSIVNIFHIRLYDIIMVMIINYECLLFKLLANRWTKIDLNIYIQKSAYRNISAIKQLMVFCARNHHFQEFTYFKSYTRLLFHTYQITELTRPPPKLFSITSSTKFVHNFPRRSTKCKFRSNNIGARE